MIGITVAVAALPLVYISGVTFIAGWTGALSLGVLLAAWAKRLLGGYTGDVLGAVERVCEIGFLLGVLAASG